MSRLIILLLVSISTMLCSISMAGINLQGKKLNNREVLIGALFGIIVQSINLLLSFVIDSTISSILLITILIFESCYMLNKHMAVSQKVVDGLKLSNCIKQ